MERIRYAPHGQLISHTARRQQTRQKSGMECIRHAPHRQLIPRTAHMIGSRPDTHRARHASGTRRIGSSSSTLRMCSLPDRRRAWSASGMRRIGSSSRTAHWQPAHCTSRMECIRHAPLRSTSRTQRTGSRPDRHRAWSASGTHRIGSSSRALKAHREQACATHA